MIYAKIQGIKKKWALIPKLANKRIDIYFDMIMICILQFIGRWLNNRLFLCRVWSI